MKVFYLLTFLFVITNETCRSCVEYIFAEASIYLASPEILSKAFITTIVLFAWALIVIANTHSSIFKKMALCIASSGSLAAATDMHPIVTKYCTTVSENPFATLLVSIIVTKLTFDLFGTTVPTLKVPLKELEASTGYEMFGKADSNMNIVDPTKPGFIQCFDPATAQRLGQVKIITPNEVKLKVEKARIAQKKWSTSSFEQRRHVLRIMMKFILEHQEDIVRLCVRDSGKTELGASFGEVLPSCEKIQWMIDNGEKVLLPENRAAARLMMYKSAWIEYVPLGVLGIISPFNYPFHNFINHIISGLFSGNSVCVKVSEHTSWSAEYFGRFVTAALIEARDSGVVPMASPDLVQVITGFGASGAALVSSGVDKIIFTGSTQVGRLVMEGAAKSNLTPCVLELGGKDPFIVLQDADVNSVFKLLMRGVFQNCGQNCIGVERVYVHESIFDDFVEKAVNKVKELRQGLPLSGATCDLGATTMPGQLAIIERLVNDAVENGATVMVGGKRNADLKPGLFYEPTILINVTHEMKIAKEEVFGPVMVIMKFSTEEELLKLANDSEFGLCSSVWSKDTAKAKRVASLLHVGMSNINDYGVNYLVQSLPFGGVKLSGYGRFGGIEGLRECCAIKSITADATSLITTAAMMPPVLDYPIGATCVEFNQGLLNMTYRTGIVQRLQGLVGLLCSLIWTTKKTPVDAKQE